MACAPPAYWLSRRRWRRECCHTWKALIRKRGTRTPASPKRTSMHQRNRHDPLARDANLRKVQRATALTFAGGVVLTGGFYAASAQAFSGAAHKVSPATVVGNVDDATGTQGSTPRQRHRFRPHHRLSHHRRAPPQRRLLSSGHLHSSLRQPLRPPSQSHLRLSQ